MSAISAASLADRPFKVPSTVCLRFTLCDPHHGFTSSSDFASIDLSAPVDVYAEWIDACDALAHDTAAAAAAPSSFSRPTQSRLPTQNAARGGLAPGEKYDTEDGFIDDDDADGEADFNDDDD